MTDLSILISKSPQIDYQAVETFDLAMSGAVFDWDIALFFVGDGLAHCLQWDPFQGQDDLSKRWLSATLFGVDRLYRLSEETWPINAELGPIAERVKAISHSEMQRILTESRRVMVL